MIFSEAKISPVGTVNSQDLRQVLKNMVVFLAPLIVLYGLQLNGVLQNRPLGFEDLMPTTTTWGGIQLYVLNALMDLIKKFSKGK